MELIIGRCRKYFGCPAAATDPNNMRCNGERQHLRHYVRHILVLHDATKLQTRPCVDVDPWRLLQKHVVSHPRLRELREKPGAKRRIILPGERIHVTDGTPGVR